MYCVVICSNGDIWFILCVDVIWEIISFLVYVLVIIQVEFGFIICQVNVQSLNGRFGRVWYYICICVLVIRCGVINDVN